MSKLKTMLVALGATALLGAGTMGAAEPQPVKKAPTTNRLFTRSAGKAATAGTATIAKAPRTGGYVSVAPAAANANLPVIIGGMLDSGSWGVGLQPYGLYQFPATEGEPFTYIRSDIYPNGGGVAVNDTYFSCEVDLSDGGASIIIRSYDMETWRNTRSFSPSDYSFIATDVAHDPITDQVYGCLWEDSGTGYMFGTIDYVNGVTRKIKSVDNLWNAIAIDADGTIYAIDQEMVPVGNEYDCAKASLYKVNRETGEMTLIGDTGLKPYYASSAVIDPRTGRMFWSVTPKDDSQSALYEVNKATGACTLVYRYPAAEQFAGMYIQAPLAEDGAPAAVEGLAAKFDRGSLSGTLSFKVPTLTYGGSNGSGAISYDIYADGTRISGGTTEWGKQENVAVTVEHGGEIEFAVSLKGTGGISPREKIKTFVGTDVPIAPTVQASWANGTMSVNWTAPQSSANGGYIDPSALTYKVTRYPGGTVVANSLSTTSFTEALPEPKDATTYYYTVEAMFDGKVSAPGTSNRVVLGAKQAPYSVFFSNLDNLDDLTVINVDPASKGWRLSAGALLLSDDPLKAKDDWIITAPVRIVPGSVYAVTVEASSQGEKYPENIEVFCGASNTAEGMTEEVIPMQEVATKSMNDYAEFTGYVSTDRERTIFIGVHGCSPANIYNLRLKSISIKPSFSSTAPGAATDLMVVPDAAGALSVSISMKAPATDYDGNPISSLSDVVISRDGEVIKTFTTPAPGSKLEFTDADVTAGEHTYTVTAHNDAGPGRTLTETVFVGVGVPVAPETVSIVETEIPGQVTISWSPVTTDVNGYSLNPELITYTVYGPSADGQQWVPVASGIKGTSTTFYATDETQIFAFYAVGAVTSGGASEGRTTELIAVGTPFKLPFIENFANGQLETLFTYETAGGDWIIAINDPNLLAQAEDNGFAKMVGDMYGSGASLISGKIDLAGAVKPVLKFSSFNYYTEATGPDYNAIDVYVRETNGKWELLKEFIVKDMADKNRWGAVSVDLNKFTGKTIQVRFHATDYTYDNTVIDQIRIDNGVDHNLSMVAISAPESVEAGEAFDIEVKVENTGLNDAGEFAVELYRDEELVESRTVKDLKAGRRSELKFSDTFTPMNEAEVEYYALLVYQPDMIAADNSSARVTVKPVLNNLPVAVNLRGTLSEGMAVLEWEEPDTDSADPDPVVENFESATSYATTSQCGWTFVDVDGAPTQEAMYGLGVIDPDDHTKFMTMPGIGDCSPMSWAVVDHNTGFGIAGWFAPHNGSKLLIALSTDVYSSGKGNDDWAISPELFGGAQTITFWAKSKENDAEWGTEKFEMLYSSKGTDIADFQLVRAATLCSTEWVKFSFDVPAGAKYFAIRYTSYDTYSMMIDDFAFIPAGATADLSLLGYNVYRDGKLVNIDPVGDTTYTDGNAENGSHDYAVTAIYDKGESRISNVVTIETSGLDSISGAGVSINAEGRTVTISGAEGLVVTVVAADGKVLAQGVAGAVFSHTLANSGVYVVTAGDTVAKIVVR